MRTRKLNILGIYLLTSAMLMFGWSVPSIQQAHAVVDFDEANCESEQGTGTTETITKPSPISTGELIRQKKRAQDALDRVVSHIELYRDTVQTLELLGFQNASHKSVLRVLARILELAKEKD